MMNKDALRKILEKLPDTEAVALAEAETAYWDVMTLNKITNFSQALAFLLSFTPVEAVGILKQLEPLTAGLLLTRIKRRMKEGEQEASELVEIIRLCDLMSIGTWQDHT